MTIFVNNNRGKTSKKDSKALAFLQYALQCKSEGRFETMLDYMDKAFKLRPDSNLLFNRAKVLDHLKEYDKALDTINRAIEMDTNHSYFIFRAQVLASLHRFDDSLNSIETAIAIYDCAYYQVAKAQMMFISGRILDGIDHMLWIRDNYNHLVHTEDINFLASALQISNTYQIKIPQLEPQFNDSIISMQEPNKSQVLRWLIDTDLFADAKISINPSLMTDILSSDTLSNQEKVIFLGSIGNWAQAEQILEQHASTLEQEFYCFYKACIDLYLNKRCTADTLVDITQWNQEAKYAFIIKLWNKKHYSALQDYFELERPTTATAKWMQFWIAVLSGNLSEGILVLKEIPQGLEEIIKSGRKSNSLELEAFGQEIDVNNLTNNLRTILELFPFDLPYDMLTWEMFIKVLKKIFPVQYSNLIDLHADIVERQSVDSPTNIDNDKYKDFYVQSSMKVELINDLSMVFISGSSSHFAVSLSIVIGASRKMGDKMNNIVESSREEERNKVLSDLSHNIKNLLRSVIDPLESIKRDIPDKMPVIEDAIKGANLIREMVNSINFSYTVSVEDLIYDIHNPGKDTSCISAMITQSLRNAISNMYDSQYYPQFMSNYFKDRQAYSDSKLKWDFIGHDRDGSRLIRFAEEYFFDLTLEIDSGSELTVGNEKSSAIKLTILLQELILNAVKYASFVPLSQRKLQISLSNEPDFIRMIVSNSYKPEVRAKTTGLGNVIIKNFAKVLDCEILTEKAANMYTVTLNLKNYWSNNG